MQSGGFRSAVRRRDLDADVFHLHLGIFDQHVKVALFVENAGIEQFKFRVRLGAPSVLLHQPRVGKLGLWILVQIAHVGMRRRAVEIEIAFLNIFAMIALRACQTKQPLLEYGIPAIPESQGKAHAPLVVADTRQAILVPAIGTGAGVLVGKIVPGFAGRAVVFAHGSPGALADVRSPALPVHLAEARLLQTFLFCAHLSVLSSQKKL